ncbi:hypothetical protein [Amaricoccus sp.]|uniref:hypothetical protein n=1 Tax=Amaricoccus sp. TaxID=1872485 RepID=UPI002625FCA7|nr:hypothetical protein [Amaricoccus sp.]HRO10950.1 hypothetical protein [Amaricoccus sp.]
MKGRVKLALELTDAEWNQVDDVIPETAELISDAAGTLDLMADMLTAGADLHPAR